MQDLAEGEGAKSGGETCCEWVERVGTIGNVFSSCAKHGGRRSDYTQNFEVEDYHQQPSYYY